MQETHLFSYRPPPTAEEPDGLLKLNWPRCHFSRCGIIYPADCLKPSNWHWWEGKWPRKECAKTANGGGGGGKSFPTQSQLWNIFVKEAQQFRTADQLVNPSQSVFPSYFLRAKAFISGNACLLPSSPLTRRQAWTDLQNQIYKPTMFVFLKLLLVDCL